MLSTARQGWRKMARALNFAPNREQVWSPDREGGGATSVAACFMAARSVVQFNGMRVYPIADPLGRFGDQTGAFGLFWSGMGNGKCLEWAQSGG